MAWRIEDFPEPFTPVIRLTRAFGTISRDPCVIKLFKVILQMFPSLYWVWNWFETKSNWGRWCRGDALIEVLLWIDKFFERLFGITVGFCSCFDRFFPDIFSWNKSCKKCQRTWEHLTKSVRLQLRDKCIALCTCRQQLTRQNIVNRIAEPHLNITQPFSLDELGFCS